MTIARRRVAAWIAVLLATAVGAAAAPIDDFRAAHGADWRLTTHADGRPRRLLGGAVPWLTVAELRGPGSGDSLVALATDFVALHESLLGVPRASVVPSRVPVVATASPRLRVVRLDLVAGNARVLDGSVTFGVSFGNLVYVHVNGIVPTALPLPAAIDANRALALAAAAASMPEASALSPPELVLIEESGGHRQVWQVDFVASTRRTRVRIDAASGAVVSARDETLHACPVPPASDRLRRVVAPVIGRYDTGIEAPEVLRDVRIEGVTAADGLHVPRAGGEPGLLELVGPRVVIDCVDCFAPPQPRARADAFGRFLLRDGNRENWGNGESTPSDRAAWARVEDTRRWFEEHLDLPWNDQPLVVRTNVPGIECTEGAWDGAAVSLSRSRAPCHASAKLRGLVFHEMGHALDEHDGAPPPDASVDSATGEGRADVIALLRTGRSCIGDGVQESTFLHVVERPAERCQGLRELDTSRRLHRLGVLTVDDADDACPIGLDRRGPLGLDAHCEGQILGQATYDLWQAIEARHREPDGGAFAHFEVQELVLASFLLMGSYAPSAIQAIGPSAHDALLVADDQGDGLANGTPRAPDVLAALQAHGLAEPDLVTVPASAAQPGPAGADAAVARVFDVETGSQALEVTWPDVGAASYRVHRSIILDDIGAQVSGVLPPGTTRWLDRSVAPGGAAAYRIIAEDAAGRRSLGGSRGRSVQGFNVLGVDVDDAASGDGDGVLDHGEAADLWLEIEALQWHASDAGRLTLSVEPPLSLLAPAEHDVLPEVHRYGPFRVQADPSGADITLLTVVGEGLDACATGEAVLELAAAEVELRRAALDDSGRGDGDLRWEPGEEVVLSPLLRNRGQREGSTVAVRLSLVPPVSSGVSVTGNEATWDPLPAGAEARPSNGELRLSADASVESGTVVTVSLDVRVDGAHHRFEEFEVAVDGLHPGRVQWRAEGGVTVDAPAVTQLTDDDGDGAVTACDVPDVVFGWSDRVALSGDDGRVLWHGTSDCRSLTSNARVATGDLDGDGRTDVVISDDNWDVCAYSHDGSMKWHARVPRDFGQIGGPTQLQDVDGDGEVEVLVGPAVLRGRDGALLWQIPDGLTFWVHPIVADLDLDCEREIVVVREVRKADGSLVDARFSSNLPGDPAAVVNMDADPEPELAFHRQDRLEVLEADGSLRFEVPLSSPDRPMSWHPHPAAADADDDGLAEVLAATFGRIVAIDDDGSLLWEDEQEYLQPYLTMGDLDADGRPEVLSTSFGSLDVRDARTGTVLWSFPTWFGGMTAIVVDVDGDGAAEIVSGGVQTAHDWRLTVAIGNPLWAPARRAWNQEAYSISHVTESGRVVAPRVPSWLASNDYRYQPAMQECGAAPPPAIRRVASPDPSLACFELDELAWWDFGEGFGTTASTSACAALDPSGLVLVRARRVDSHAVPRVLAVMACATPQLRVEVLGPSTCAQAPACWLAIPSGGVPPYRTEWDLGDGRPPLVGAQGCRPEEGEPGPRTITVTTTDAIGWAARVAFVTTLGGAADPPEAASGGGDLSVRREAESLAIRWRASGYPESVAVGDLRALHSGWTHALAACGVERGESRIATPAHDAYVLVAASSCTDASRDGGLGTTSLGDQRGASQGACP